MKMSYLTEVCCLYCVPVQKGECIIITQIIRNSKQMKRELAVKWFDVKNAYGFMPHKL